MKKFTRLFPVLLPVFLLMIGTTGAQTYRPKIEKFTLKNGLSVILHRDATFEQVAVAIAFPAGSSLDPQRKSGVANIVSSLLLGGGKEFPQEKLDDFQKMTQTSFSALTDADCLTIFSSSHKDNLNTLLRIEADRLRNVAVHFDAARFKELTTRLVEERRRGREAPMADLDMKIRAELYSKSHPYRRPAEGDPAEFKNITVQDARTFAAKYIVAGRASLVVGGDIDLDATKALVTRLFEPIEDKSKNRGKVDVPIQRKIGGVYMTVEEKIAYTRLMMVFPTVNSASIDAPALDATARILAGSINARLNSGLAEVNPFVVAVDASQSSELLAGKFTITVQCKLETQLQSVHDRVLEVLADIANNAVADAEIAEAGNGAEMRFLTAVERLPGPGGRCDILNLGNLFFEDPFHEFTMVESQMQLRPVSIQQVVQRYLNPENLLVVSIVPVGRSSQAVK